MMIKNKKGAVVLRDIMFMIIIFAGVLSLLSIFVLDFSAEYSNSNLTTEYNDLGVSGLGGSLTGDINETVTDMRLATASEVENEGGLLGSFGQLGGFLSGATAILFGVFKAPIMVGNALEIMMNALSVPQVISIIISNLIITLIYIVIIFVLISAALRGGKV